MRAVLPVLLLVVISPVLWAQAGPMSGSADLSDAQLISKLVAGLDDPDPEVRMNLGMALAQLGSKSVPPLIEALEQGSPYQRAGAAYALSQLRMTARPALPALLKALKVKEEMVRRNAAYAVNRILTATSDNIVPSADTTKSPAILPPLDPTPSNLPTEGAPR